MTGDIKKIVSRASDEKEILSPERFATKGRSRLVEAAAQDKVHGDRRNVAGKA